MTAAQGSSAWMYARCGFATGSHAADILGFLKKGGETQARANYKMRVLTEILTGNPWQDNFVSDDMRWGTDDEPRAVAAYEVQTGNECDPTGFILHPTIARMGGSPDRLIGGDGILEVKCPRTNNHLRWMLDGIVPEEHEPQMSFYLAVTGRKWAEFASFDPRLPQSLQLFTCRLQRNSERITAIEEAVAQFNSEITALIDRLRALKGDFVIPAQMTAKAPDLGELGITDEDLKYIS